jgi:hypothetical protein
MGEKLAKIYRIVEERGGNPGRISLALKTGLPRKDAEEMKDRPDVIEKFKAAAAEILGQSIDEFLQ